MDNTDDVEPTLYLKLRLAGKDPRLAVEAIEALGPNASWDELITYGEDGEPEAQIELTKRMGWGFKTQRT